MNINKILKISVVVILLLTIMSTSILVYAADSKEEVNKQIDNVDSKIDDTKKEIGDVQDDLSDGMKEIQKMNEEINEYQNQIDDLNNELEDLEDQIKVQEEELEKAEENYKQQDELMRKRLVALYEAGQTSYLDVLLNSDSISNFLSRYYLISEIAKSDSELLTDLENSKKEIEIKKQNLETSKEQVETKKQNIEETSEALADKKKLKDKQVSVLSNKEKELQEQLDQFEADKRAIQKRLEDIIKAEQEKEKNKGSSVVSIKPSASGYIFPIIGLSKANINNKNYPSYPGHTGVDVNINVSGKTIVAVKSGTVVISEALKNPNGTYRSYGEYIVINHHDGTMTLYAHGKAGSRKVKEGQEVSQGQALMTVGSTGNSTGEHLHFEVKVNGRSVNPLPYLP